MYMRWFTINLHMAPSDVVVHDQTLVNGLLYAGTCNILVAKLATCVHQMVVIPYDTRTVVHPMIFAMQFDIGEGLGFNPLTNFPHLGCCSVICCHLTLVSQCSTTQVVCGGFRSAHDPFSYFPWMLWSVLHLKVPPTA